MTDALMAGFTTALLIGCAVCVAGLAAVAAADVAKREWKRYKAAKGKTLTAAVAIVGIAAAYWCGATKPATDRVTFLATDPEVAYISDNGSYVSNDVVVGTFYICGLTREDFGSISDELAEKYTELFRYPEMLMPTLDGDILWFKLGSGESPKEI